MFEQPAHPYTRQLLDSFPSLTGERGSFVRSGEQMTPVDRSGEPTPSGGGR
jgi:ABC-type dipeptide/oligopeptide/nickel transport system ATPase component